MKRTLTSNPKVTLYSLPSSAATARPPTPPSPIPKIEAVDPADDDPTDGPTTSSSLNHATATSPPKRVLRSRTNTPLIIPAKRSASPASSSLSPPPKLAHLSSLAYSPPSKLVTHATALSSKPSTSSTKSPASKPKATKPKPPKAPTAPVPAPPNWLDQYELIEAQRAKGPPAPVDGMGCSAAGEEDGLEAGEKGRKGRFAVLISLMLSSQTKDELTHRAIQTLRTTLPGGLTPTSLSEATDDVVKTCISCVGFANRKTLYIKAAALDCLSLHDGDIPNTIEGLLALKGVGPKMGYLVLEHAWNLSTGIGVDIHVERITNRLGWHPKPTNVPAPTPELARHNLESWLPTSYWRPLNPLLVGHGQLTCRAVKPRCGECDVGLAGLCPSFQSPDLPGKEKGKGRVKKGVEGGELSRMKEEAMEEEEVDPLFKLEPSRVGEEEERKRMMEEEVVKAKEVEKCAPAVKVEVED